MAPEKVHHFVLALELIKSFAQRIFIKFISSKGFADTKCKNLLDGRGSSIFL